MIGHQDDSPTDGHQGDMPYLTLKHRETHGCVVNIVATDTLVLKHQAISSHSVDTIFILLECFHTTILHSEWNIMRK